jgi:hypothetical protein
MSIHTDDLADTREEAEWLRNVVKVRSLLAMAESSEFAEEAEVYTRKAEALATKYDIDAALLQFPHVPLAIAVVVAELRHLNTQIERYEKDPEIWDTKTAEWSQLLDEYDEALEQAADWLQVPLRPLLTGSRRHFRPADRAHIEGLLAAAGLDVRPPRSEPADADVDA